MTRRRMFKIIILGPIALAIFTLGILHIYFRLGPRDVTISKETTHILGPVNDDGTIDYVAYMNAEHSKGVTKENNAAIGLIEILGPSFAAEEGQADICRILGINVPAGENDYFTALCDIEGVEPETLDDNLANALKHPWAAEQYPAIARWLKTNQHALDATVIAVRRTRYYIPSVVADDAEWPVAEMSIPAVQSYVSIAQGLCARAMLKLNSGRIDSAWTDLMAARRLARRVGAGYSLVEGLVALGVENIACQTINAVTGSGKLSETQARAFLADLQHLPPLRDLADMIDQAERFMLIDSLLKTANKTKLPGWDKVLIKANRFYDTMVAAFRQDTFKARTEAMKEHSRRVDEFLEERETRSFISSLWWHFSDPAGATGDNLIYLLLPSIGRAMVLRDRATVEGDLTVVAMALAAYRAEKKAYPDNLSQLAPSYLEKIPDDLFIDKPFHYESKCEGYLLYSVGENMKYDGPLEDEYNTTDDIVVRVE
jgi:hypothetical protein